jgi:hypothetical protein
MHILILLMVDALTLRLSTSANALMCTAFFPVLVNVSNVACPATRRTLCLIVAHFDTFRPESD